MLSCIPPTEKRNSHTYSDIFYFQPNSKKGIPTQPFRFTEAIFKDFLLKLRTPTITLTHKHVRRLYIPTVYYVYGYCLINLYYPSLQNSKSITLFVRVRSTSITIRASLLSLFTPRRLLPTLSVVK